MAEDVSALEAARASYEPRVPSCLAADGVEFKERCVTRAVMDADEVRAGFPRTFGRPLLDLVEGNPPSVGPLHVGVVLSGGQAPGGHNVIAGLFDGLEAYGPASRLTGFLGGPRGILNDERRELTAEEIAPYRNTGGFDLIGSGRDKIATATQLEVCAEACRRLDLTGLVIVGGDDSNTNAAVLAEHFLASGVDTAVVGVPKTIDGDLKGHGVEVSFGFDTATKLYSELIGNICRDAKSAAKYWHFVKLMGRSASHVTLECALRTHPNVALIGEEVRRRGLTLGQVADQVAQVIRARADAGRSYGVCLIPEGLIEFIPEVGRLIDALNTMLGYRAEEFASLPDAESRMAFARGELSAAERLVFDALPLDVRVQLLHDRDAHGNVQVSKIETEQILIDSVRGRLAESGWGGKLSVQGHFFGYEGRCAAPSNFDADYTYALGRLAALLTASGKTGFLCAVGNLTAPPADWTASGIPLTSMMQIESRGGRRVPVIGKALVDLDGAPFRRFASARDSWATMDDYRYPGAIQYFGPPEVSASIPETLRLEQGASSK